MPRKTGRFVRRFPVLPILGLAAVLALSAIIPAVNLTQKKAKAAAAVFFPGDHGQHTNYLAEWWYLNLLVRTTKTNGTDEKDLGHVISFSRIAGNKGLLSSRYDNNTKSFKESTNTGGSLTVSLLSGKYMLVKYANGLIAATLEEKPPGADRKKIYKLTGKTGEIGTFDLTMKERTVVSTGFNTPLLWGGTTGNCRGKIPVFGGDDTFYYSIPDLDITGTITDIDGAARAVKAGKGWIDHQWFNTLPPGDWKGHYWTGMHLTNSGSIYDTAPHQAVGFVTQIYNSGPRYTYWVKRNTDGTNECGTGGRATINSYGTTNYPSSWKFELNKSNNMFLQMSGISFSDNQIFKPPSGPQFFEPAAYYSGSINGKTFTGLGFFETHLNKSMAITKNSSTVTLRAYGTPGGGIYPNMDILVDNIKVKTFTVTGAFADYVYTHPFAVDGEQIKVRLPNDYFVPPQDRNLRVDKMTINGRVYQTEANNTLSTGTLTSDTGCAPGFKLSEWLHCNGYFHYLANYY